MNHGSYDDGYIRGILNTVKTIAMVGVSANTSRPSYFFKYLLERGYHMIPVNPGLAEQGCWGRRPWQARRHPEPVDMVDIFRASQYAGDRGGAGAQATAG
jgi:predicted CoA-binding protein